MRDFLIKKGITRLDEFGTKMLFSSVLMLIAVLITSSVPLKIIFLLIVIFQVFIMNEIKLVIKIKQNQRKIDLKLEKKRIIYRECLDLLSTIGSLLKEKYEDSEEIINDFTKELNDCNNYNDYLFMKNRLYNSLVRLFLQFREEEYSNRKSSDTNTHPNNIMECFKILGIPDDVKNFEIIKKIYIEKVKKYHPDNNDNYDSSLEKTQELNIAYNNLKAYFK